MLGAAASQPQVHGHAGAAVSQLQVHAFFGQQSVSLRYRDMLGAAVSEPQVQAYAGAAVSILFRIRPSKKSGSGPPNEIRIWIV